MSARTRERVSVGSLEDFDEGRFVLRKIGKHEIGVIRLRDSRWRAVRNWCPHKGAPICKGIVGGTWPPSAPGELIYDGNSEILVCPWHGFEYDLATGRELYRETPTKLRLYEVSVIDGTVFVDI